MEKEGAAILGLCLVDFHHTRGPEVEYWCGLPEGTDSSKIWPNLPFQALPDGSHSFKETFTYFTLLFNEKKKTSPPSGATNLPEDELEDYTTLFAISCSRQIRSDELTFRDKDVTRSTVQKAIVVISRQPIFVQIKDKLSLVTNAFFLQKDFSDRSIIKSLYGNLISMFDTLPINPQESRFYVGLSLRRIVYDFKKDTLVLLKAVLLEKKVVFYATNVEALCNLQFGLISLIPNLLSNLENSGSPQLYESREDLKTADSFKSSDRQSVLRFMGFPLKVFEKGGLFSPYTPLQQMDDISSPNTDFFMIGSSNSLLTEQKSEFCHIFINVDDSSIEVIDKSLQQALQLSSQDRKWIEYISNMVSETWNENDLFTPKNSQFEGSEDFLRWQFEDYLTGLLSSVKLSDYTEVHKNNPLTLQSIPEEVLNANPISLFNINWVAKWKKTQNYSIFNETTDDRIFDIFPPKHAYNGIDTLTAIQQKLTATFHNLKRTNSNSIVDKEKDKDINPVESSKESDILSKSTTATDASQTYEERDQNIWSSWKDYFNARKQKKKGELENVVKATQHLNNSSSTPSAIGNALIGLGLHLDDYDETNGEDQITEEGEINAQATAPTERYYEPSQINDIGNTEKISSADYDEKIKAIKKHDNAEDVEGSKLSNDVEEEEKNSLKETDDSQEAEYKESGIDLDGENKKSLDHIGNNEREGKASRN